MPPNNVHVSKANPPNLDFQGRKGTTFIQSPDYFEWTVDRHYYGGWKYPKLQKGWSLEKMEQDLIARQKIDRELVLLTRELVQLARGGQHPLVADAFIIHYESVCLAKSKNGQQQQSTPMVQISRERINRTQQTYSSTPDFLSMFPGGVEEDEQEEIQEIQGTRGEPLVKEYEVLDPDHCHMHPASAAQIQEYNTLHTSMPDVPHAIVTLEKCTPSISKMTTPFPRAFHTFSVFCPFAIFSGSFF
ncbi:hypothetical protein B0H19DRAFT_1068924 [Mycena capillaripes]|nr:hypothetical protein B0H19DRAFT_1068924 [Mycena capillaripes]